MTAGRLIAVLAAALAAVAGLGYLASQTVLAPTPWKKVPRQYVAAPAPLPAPASGHRRHGAQSPPRVDARWVRATAATARIPAPALRAYANAQLARPAGCDIGWTTLAGIGWVESHHGTLGGRTLHADGHASVPILGPALDGTGNFAAIPATRESTTWHGDPAWDHAVGPLQFIPSTWEMWRSDGDGNGTADPNDLDDAAYAAARYLCAGGHDLTTGAGWAAAVLSYNQSQSYVDAVHAAATAYAGRTS
jgi:membrane-bound lytic murein transglycosylase B